MKFGLPDMTITEINRIVSSFGNIEKVILFGSRALGNQKNGSDIDLAVSGANIGLQEHNQLANALDDLLLPYKVDLQVLENIKNDELLTHIERAGKLIYCKKMSKTKD